MAGVPKSILEIVSWDFESGWQGWTDGGANAARISNSNNAHSGTYALRIQGNTATSTVTSNRTDVSLYSTIFVDFFFKPVRMTDLSESFHLGISKDGGPFNAVYTWTSLDMDDSQWNQGIVEISASGVSTVSIRFECEGATTKD